MLFPPHPDELGCTGFALRRHGGWCSPGWLPVGSKGYAKQASGLHNSNFTFSMYTYAFGVFWNKHSPGCPEARAGPGWGRPRLGLLPGNRRPRGAGCGGCRSLHGPWSPSLWKQAVPPPPIKSSWF